MSSPDDELARPAQLTPRNIAITSAVAVALHAPALFRTAALDSDEATIAVIARMMRHGLALYTGAVDRKPPGAFVLYRLLEPTFGSGTLMAGRWLTLGLTVAAAWLLGFEARRRWPSVSPFAVALLGVLAFALLPAEDSRAVGFELLATLPAVVAFVLGARGRTTLAGVALGVAALFKQPMLLGAAPLMVQCLDGMRPATAAAWRGRLGRLLGAGTVTAATVLAGLAPFGLRRAWDWYSGVGDNYLGGAKVTTVAVVTLEQLGCFAGLTMGLLIAAVVGWHRGPGSPTPAGAARSTATRLDILVWLVAGFAATAIGLRFLLHYFNQVLPPLILLAAPVLTRRSSPPARMVVLARLWLAGGVAFSAWTVLAPDLFHDLPAIDRVAAAIDARTVAGQRIFVWGQAPELYWVADRDPATRFPHIGFITGVTPKRPGVAPYVLDKPGAATTLLEDLERNRPALVVDAAIEAVRGGNRYPLATSPVAAFVAANYCEIEVVDQVRLLAPCSP